MTQAMIGGKKARRVVWSVDRDFRGVVHGWYAIETITRYPIIHEVTDNADDARRCAEKLAQEHGIEVALATSERAHEWYRAGKQHEQALDQARAEAQAELARRQGVVCGKIKEAPACITDDELVIDDDVCAIPSLGGILADLPLSADSRARFPEEFVLPVTVSAAKTDSWVVVNFGGRGVAMTINEAYERGLRQAPNWFPDASSLDE